MCMALKPSEYMALKPSVCGIEAIGVDGYSLSELS